jgi:hypothetical protein
VDAFPIEYVDDDLYTVEEWVAHCKVGAFTNYDGCGNLIIDGKRANGIVPSLVDQIPDNATHVIWYNK